MGTGDGGLAQSIALPSTGAVAWSADVFIGDGSSATVGVQFIDTDAGWDVLEQRTEVVYSTSYVNVGGTATAPAGTDLVQWYIWKADGPGYAYIDNVRLEASDDAASVGGGGGGDGTVGANLIGNSGFEEGFAGWSNWYGATASGGGVSGQAGRVGTGAGGFGQPLDLPASGTVTFSADVLVADGSSATVGVQFIDTDGGWDVIGESTEVVTSSSFVNVGGTATAPAGTDVVQWYIWKEDGPGYAYVDNVSVREVTGGGGGDDSSANAVTNGDFSAGLSGWSTYAGSGASATFEVDNGNALGSGSSLRTGITSSGTDLWNVSLEQSAIGLTVGETYTLSFKARSSGGATMNAFVENNDDGWTNFGSSLWSQSIGTSTQTYDFTFTATRDTATLKFQMGTSFGDIWIGDVMLLKA